MMLKTYLRVTDITWSKRTYWREVTKAIKVVSLAIVICCVANSMALSQFTVEVQEADEPSQVQVYALKYVSAELASQVLSGVFADHAIGGRLRMIPEVRTNSIIISGPEKALLMAQKTLEALDTDRFNRSAPADFDRLTTHTLSCLLIVERTADPRLANAVGPTSQSMVEILNDMELRFPELKLQDPCVAVALGTQVSPRLLADPRRAAEGIDQSEIVKMNSGRFQLQGASHERGYSLQMEGSLVGQDEQFLFSGRTTIQVERPALSEGQAPRSDVAKLTTEVALRPNQPVVLSMTALDGQKCLLVLEIR